MKKRHPPPTHFPYQRLAKIHKHFEQIPYNANAIEGNVNLLEKVPSLKLEGDWLLEAGFCCKTTATVTVAQGCLVITAEKTNN